MQPVVRHQLGNSQLSVSPVGFGCWPIAGVSSLGVNDRDSLATIHAAIDSGINFFDTAFSYGYKGEANQLLSQVLADRRQEVVLASKVGSYYTPDRQRVVEGSAKTLIAHAEAALRDLGVSHVEVMYLHQPDPRIPIEESASGIAEIVRRGWALAAGVSNVDAEQLARFHRVCPVAVVQPPYNMVQRTSVDSIRDVCQRENIAIACYWVLMKGLLAGKLSRDHQFDPSDRRLTYPIFQGEAWQRSQDLLDDLRDIAQQIDCTVAQLVIAWTLSQPDISVALCGAKRPEQIQETAQAMQIKLCREVLEKIDARLQEFGVSK